MDNGTKKIKQKYLEQELIYTNRLHTYTVTHEKYINVCFFKNINNKHMAREMFSKLLLQNVIQNWKNVCHSNVYRVNAVFIKKFKIFSFIIVLLVKPT